MILFNLSMSPAEEKLLMSPFSSSTSVAAGGIPEELSRIRRQIEKLRISSSVFIGLEVGKGYLHAAELGGEEKVVLHKKATKGNTARVALNWLASYPQKNMKVIAASIAGFKDPQKLASQLWLKEDIVPYIMKGRGRTPDERVKSAAYVVAQQFNDDNSFSVNINSRNEVEIAHLVTLEDYAKTVPAGEFARLLELAKSFRGKRLTFISATPQGGGVALMRHALIRLFRLLGVNARWFVLEDRREIFEITKRKFHNVLQDVAAPATRLNEGDKEMLEAWWADNAELFRDIVKDTDVVIIDDPQPAGLVPHIRKINPRAKIIYRSHIHLMASLVDEPGTAQHTTWSFIWQKIKSADSFVAHPVKEFVPKKVSSRKVVFMPPATDPLDGLNKKLNAWQLSYYLKIFNKMLLESGQTPLSAKRPCIIQIARFDPSKGIPDVITSYRMLCARFTREGKATPQLVVAGNSSVDDPDGIPVYNLITSMLQQDRYAAFAEGVKVVKLPHYDQILNAILRASHIALQLSYKEGFEVKVSEALAQGKPVIAYRTGGIPLQVKHGINGYLVKLGSATQVTDRLYELLTDEQKYQKMSQAAEKEVSPDVWTVPNAINWLFMANELLEKGKFEGNGQYIRDLILRNT